MSFKMQPMLDLKKPQLQNQYNQLLVLLWFLKHKLDLNNKLNLTQSMDLSAQLQLKLRILVQKQLLRRDKEERDQFNMLQKKKQS